MWLIGLTISLFSIIKTRALECVSVINRKCMPRPKILDVNECVDKALFYPYNVLVNKCSGSCDTINNPMTKLCVSGIAKRVNMQVYNFLMRLNETRSVLWHESCKCVCKLNSSVCNNKQIWNSDTCKCDFNEDFASIMNCTEGYMWNPSTCECQCDIWCKPGQHLDHKNCIRKNKLIGRIIVLTLLTKLYINDKTITNIFIVLFSIVMFILIVCSCVFIYFKWFKNKKILTTLIKIVIKSLKIKNKSYYYWYDIIFIDDFNIKFFKIAKRESRAGIDIYYIGYLVKKIECDINSVKPLYLNVKSLLGSVEKIDGSNDIYLVIDKSNIKVINVFNTLREYIDNKVVLDKIDEFDKIRFSSDIDLPLGTLIQLKILTIIIRCIIKKDGKYYPEIYLDECMYNKTRPNI